MILIRRIITLIVGIVLVFSSCQQIILAQENPFDPAQDFCISQSIVQLRVTSSDGSVQEASGVIVSQAGIIFTNQHVAADAFEIQVLLFQDSDIPPILSYNARSILISETIDFAIIEIFADAQGNPLSTIDLNLSCILSWNINPMSRYEPIFVVGYPDVAGGVLNSTTGIISAIQRQETVDGQEIIYYQTDASFSNGGSGGAVINSKGEFIGIPAYWQADYEAPVQSTFFIPLSTICEVELEACGYLPSNNQQSIESKGITEQELAQLIAQNEDTGDLIQALDIYWGNDPSKGGDWGPEGITIEGPAVFWTDIFNDVYSLPQGVSTVKVQGGWGVYRIETGIEYIVPSSSVGGRYLNISTNQPVNSNILTGSPSSCASEAMNSSLVTSGESLYTVGSGVFTNVIRPSGYTPTELETVTDLYQHYPCIQYIVESTPVLQGTNDRCIVSRYHTNRIWFGIPVAGTSIIVKKANETDYLEIGHLDLPSQDTMAYVLEYELNPNDEICVRGISEPPTNFHLRFGPDLEHHIQSWCLVLNDTVDPPIYNYCN